MLGQNETPTRQLKAPLCSLFKAQIASKYYHEIGAAVITIFFSRQGKL